MDTASAFAVLPLDKILASKTNPRKRFNQDDLKDLAASIKKHGVMQPILVRPLKGDLLAEYEIVAGERRWRASQIAEMIDVPAMISDIDDIEALQLQIIENLQRSDLHPMEEAQGFKALLDNKDAKSWNADELAAKVGKSRTYIYNSLKLNELCVYAQDMFFDEKFGRETAVLLARIPGEKLQTQATKEIVKGQGLEPYSYRLAKSHIHSRYTLDLTAAKFDTNSKTLIPEAGACFSCPKRSGNYPELFSDIESADVCTDPDCFASKKAAHIEIVVAQHARVLRGEDAKKIMPGGANSYVSGSEYSKLANYDRDHRFDQSYAEILGDDLPEPLLVVDADNNMAKLYPYSALKEKIEEKIASGDLVVPIKPEREKSEHQIQREKVEAAQEIEKARRRDMFKKLAPYIDATWSVDILKLAIASISSTARADLTPIMNIFGFEGEADSQDEHAFFDEYLSKDQPIGDLVRLTALLIFSEALSLNWSWEGEENNKDDKGYQRLVAFINDSGLAKDDNFFNSETASTPPIAAQAEELSADEKTDTAALADAKTLPPAMQKKKDAYLAKKAKKDAKASKDVSANADASNTSLAEPSQTNAGVTQ